MRTAAASNWHGVPGTWQLLAVGRIDRRGVHMRWAPRWRQRYWSCGGHIRMGGSAEGGVVSGAEGAQTVGNLQLAPARSPHRHRRDGPTFSHTVPAPA
jgi:hypothetical protein